MSSPTKSPRTPTGTPRKRPTCTKCGEPMLGHKRNQCQTPIKTEPPRPGPGGRRKSLTPIDYKMNALNIATPEKDEQERAQRRRSLAPVQKAETLVSLSSNDKATLSILAKPGMMSAKSPVEEEIQVAGNIEKWLESVTPPASPRKSRQSRGPLDIKPDIEAMQDLQDATDMLADDANEVAPRPKVPLQRTYSAREMDDFLESLEERSTQPKTQIYRIPAADVGELRKRAIRCNLFVRGAVPEKGDGWVVIGADKDAVEEVCDRIASDQRHEKGGMKGVLGSGFVGAAITWLVLAYS